MYSHGPPHMAVQKQDDQHEHTFSSYVRIRDVVLKTYLGRWTIGRSGERGSGISVSPARYDDDDDDDISIYTLDLALNIFYKHKQRMNKPTSKLNFVKVEYLFITISPRSTLTRSGSICKYPMYGSSSSIRKLPVLENRCKLFV